MQLTLVIKLASMSLGLDSFFSNIFCIREQNGKILFKLNPPFPFKPKTKN